MSRNQIEKLKTENSLGRMKLSGNSHGRWDSHLWLPWDLQGMTNPSSSEYILISLLYPKGVQHHGYLDKVCRQYLINREVHEGKKLHLGTTSVVIHVLKCIPETSSIVTVSTRLEYSHGSVATLHDSLCSRIKKNIVGMDNFLDNLGRVLSQRVEAPPNDMNPIGMIIEAPSASGKTLILRNIDSCFSPRAHYLDCNSLLAHCQRCVLHQYTLNDMCDKTNNRRSDMVMALETFLLKSYSVSRTSDASRAAASADAPAHLLLLDNIDAIARKFPQVSSDRTTSSQHQTSTATEDSVLVGYSLCSLLDRIREQYTWAAPEALSIRPFVIATCTYSSTLPSGLFRPYRMGDPLVMPIPSALDRMQAARAAIEWSIPAGSPAARCLRVEIESTQFVLLAEGVLMS